MVRQHINYRLRYILCLWQFAIACDVMGPYRYLVGTSAKESHVCATWHRCQCVLAFWSSRVDIWRNCRSLDITEHNNWNTYYFMITTKKWISQKWQYEVLHAVHCVLDKLWVVCVWPQIDFVCDPKIRPF